MDRAFTCDAERTVSAHIQGRPRREHPKAKTPTTNMSKLNPGPLASRCSFLLNRTPVISVSINNRIPTKIAGIMAANIQAIDMLLFIPPGLMNQSRLGYCVGRKPSFNGSFIDTCGVMTLSPREKSRTTIISIAMTIPESPTSLLVCNEITTKY